MDLSACFERVATTQQLKVTEMVRDRRYAIDHAKRVTTHHGPTIQFVILDVKDDSHYEIYLPQRYARVVTDDDIERINAAHMWWHIEYQGYCKIRRLPILEIRRTIKVLH
jgi:hypothetical protein